jgi:hypothetical protein
MILHFSHIGFTDGRTFMIPFGVGPDGVALVTATATATMPPERTSAHRTPHGAERDKAEYQTAPTRLEPFRSPLHPRSPGRIPPCSGARSMTARSVELGDQPLLGPVRVALGPAISAATSSGVTLRRIALSIGSTHPSSPHQQQRNPPRNTTLPTQPPLTYVPGNRKPPRRSGHGGRTGVLRDRRRGL